MTTLIIQRVGQDAERRCDAKCYNAAHADCDCCCGGMNHGAGLQVALDNTADLVRGELTYIQAQGFELDARLAALVGDDRQPDLFVSRA